MSGAQTRWARWAPWALALAVLVTGWQVMATGLSQVATNSKSGPLAYRLRPANGAGTALYADLEWQVGDLAKAQALAREAIASSPLNVRAIRVLGQARERARPGTGDALLVQSARLSWRDGPTQIWIVQRALQANQLSIATERAEALLRIEHEGRLTFALVRLMLTHPPARAYFLHSLEKRPYWRHDFMFADVATLPPDQIAAMAALLRDLGKTKAPPSIVEARATIDALVAGGKADEAYALYKMASGRVRAGELIDNPGFEDASLDYTSGGNSTVFDWRAYSEGQTAAGVERRPEEKGNRVLYATTEGGSDATLAERAMVLAPGAYRLDFRIRSLDREAPRAFRVRVHCASGSEIAISPAGSILPGDAWRSVTVPFSVPAGCTQQVLQVVADHERGASSEAFFDDIRVSPAATRAR